MAEHSWLVINMPRKQSVTDTDYQKLLQRALNVIQQISGVSKNPKLIEDFDHEYDDKFTTVEFMTNLAIAAVLDTLDKLNGFNDSVLKRAVNAVTEQNRSATLRFVVERKCRFLELTKAVAIEPPSTTLTHKIKEGKVEEKFTRGENNDGDNSSKKSSSRWSTVSNYVKEAKEYHWMVTIQWKMVLFFSGSDQAAITLERRKGAKKIITQMKTNPPFPAQGLANKDVDLTWLFKNINPSTLKYCFAIDREHATTPRRNKQIDQANTMFTKMLSWCVTCRNYFVDVVRLDLEGNIEEKKDETNYAHQLTKINADNVFTPIVPLFMQNEDAQSDESNEIQKKTTKLDVQFTKTSPLIPPGDISRFLEEHYHSLEAERKKLADFYPSAREKEKIVTNLEAMLILFWSHLIDLSIQCIEGWNYVEDVLHKQLTQATGKEIDSNEFNAFMRYRNQQIFMKQYSPKQFCYKIRQTKQFPDGVFSIVAGSGSSEESSQPIETFVRCIPGGDSLSSPMSITINAFTTVQFVGDQYLHGWIDTHLAKQTQAQHYLNARAQQFSCFLLVLGKVSGLNKFVPKDAIILQNGDELLIPLLLNDLQSAKDCKDASKSLSPEQSRFLRSFRTMQQLKSSVFGFCVIRVKPQLEALLNLPTNSITNEIQLIQDLLQLLVECQIPPNFVSFNGPESTPTEGKLNVVESHVKARLDGIQGIKDSQLSGKIEKKPYMPELNELKSSTDLSFSARDSTSGVNSRLSMMKKMKAKSRSLSVLSSKPGGALQGEFSPQTSAVLKEDVYVRADGKKVRRVRVKRKQSTVISAPSISSDITANYLADEGASKQNEFHLLHEKDSMGISPTNGKEIAQHPTNFSEIPRQLDQLLQSYGNCNHTLRSVTHATVDQWELKRQENLPTKLQAFNIEASGVKGETNKALYLLEVLSSSGSLPIVSGELHIIVSVCHSFEKNVMDTIIINNVNPIEKVDFSSLLVASCIHEESIPKMVTNCADVPNILAPTLGGINNDAKGGGDNRIIIPIEVQKYAQAKPMASKISSSVKGDPIVKDCNNGKSQTMIVDCDRVSKIPTKSLESKNVAFEDDDNINIQTTNMLADIDNYSEETISSEEGTHSIAPTELPESKKTSFEESAKLDISMLATDEKNSGESIASEMSSLLWENPVLDDYSYVSNSKSSADPPGASNIPTESLDPKNRSVENGDSINIQTMITDFAKAAVAGGL